MKKESLYPLSFFPSYHYRIWGGNQWENVFGKNIQEENIGESWEISVVPDFVSKVASGSLEGQSLVEVIQMYESEPELFMGTSVQQKFGNDFPLLIKFIDTDAPLSVQVHPNDEYAAKHHQSLGKNEMWYIMDSEPDSDLVIGFEKGVDKEIYLEHLENGTLEEILRSVHPKAKEVYDIPAGRVHAIGKGVRLAEIQQNSDITYRIYDYNRIDKDGKTRELHTQPALEVAAFDWVEKPATTYKDALNHLNPVVENSYFKTSKLHLNDVWENPFSNDSFTIYIGVGGKTHFIYKDKKYSLDLGQCLLIPAGIENHRIEPSEEAEILCVRM